MAKKNTEAAAVTPGSAVETVVLRNFFYRDNYYRMMTLTLWLLLLAFALMGFIYFQQATRPTPKYFATTPDGALIELIPLDEPNLSPNTLLQWATQAATASYTFNFVNYRQAFQDARIYFTPDGYNNFIKAIEASRNLEAVKQKKLVVSAVPTGVPVVVNEGRISGRYAWQIEMPMLISYQSANERIVQNIKLTMLVLRVSTLESPRGLGIGQFIVETVS
ncbi:MAG: type IVB secretion system apparatus protein IcmL/DotI [Pseudomonadota bacterium]